MSPTSPERFDLREIEPQSWKNGAGPAGADRAVAGAAVARGPADAHLPAAVQSGFLLLVVDLLPA